LRGIASTSEGFIAMDISIKRAYEAPAQKDGFRILVDRLWPRGLTKAKADIDLWAKEVAPSTELRKWFNHDPDKWKEFQIRYRNELKNNEQALSQVREQAAKRRVTLIYGAKDERHNEAIVLQELLTASNPKSRKKSN
jgi:uncharacterized protein YeaO (DUF488 family)